MAELTKELKDRVKRGQRWECAKCHKSIKSGGHIHHKNGNHNDNRISNLEALCKGCHEKITKKQRKSPAIRAQRQAVADRRYWLGW